MLLYVIRCVCPGRLTVSEELIKTNFHWNTFLFDGFNFISFQFFSFFSGIIQICQPAMKLSTVIANVFWILCIVDVKKYI